MRPARRWGSSVDDVWSPQVGDTVHCPHAQADGIVLDVREWCVIVRVTVTYGKLYDIGAEYAWLPMQLEPAKERMFN